MGLVTPLTGLTTNKSMKIQLNGEEKEIQASNAGVLLKELNLLPTQVAIEHNGIVLFRHEYDQTSIKEGDRIEVVRVVAGG